jgi:hypothetical protein
MCITIRKLGKVVRSLGGASAPATKRRRVPRSVADGFAAASLPVRTRAELRADARTRKRLREARLHTEQPQQLALVRAPTLSLRLVPGNVLQKLIATNTFGAAMDTTSLMMPYVAAARCELRSSEHNLCDEDSTALNRYFLLDSAGMMGSTRDIELATSARPRKIRPYVVRLAAYLVLEDRCARATIGKEFTRRYPLDCLELYIEFWSSDETPMAVSLVDVSRNSRGPRQLCNNRLMQDQVVEASSNSTLLSETPLARKVLRRRPSSCSRNACTECSCANQTVRSRRFWAPH